MAITTRYKNFYKDIDLNLNNTIYNDFAVLNDANSIKKTLINNIMMITSERHLDNNIFYDIHDLIHGLNNEEDIIDVLNTIISRAVSYDKRIVSFKIQNYKYDYNSYAVSVDVNVYIRLTPNAEAINTNFILQLQTN